MLMRERKDGNLKFSWFTAISREGDGYSSKAIMLAQKILEEGRGGVCPREKNTKCQQFLRKEPFYTFCKMKIAILSHPIRVESLRTTSPPENPTISSWSTQVTIESLKLKFGERNLDFKYRYSLFHGVRLNGFGITILRVPITDFTKKRRQKCQLHPSDQIRRQGLSSWQMTIT